jgi:hypothetical protein
MSFNHDEIREMFPEYLSGSLSEEERNAIAVHLRDCSACRSELSMMSELVSIDAPDPGNLFWETLPQKVKVLVKEKKAHRFTVKSLFFKFVPAAAALAILLGLLLTGTEKNGLYEFDTYSNDPFMATYQEYNGLEEEDIYLLTEKTAGDELYVESDDLMEYSYHVEFASLSSEEMNSLYEALETEKTRGG